MRAWRGVMGIAVAVVLAGTLAASSGVAVPWHDEGAAHLRLSWSARPERIETCRTLTDEEYAQRPAHMRQRIVCQGTTATYALRVTADGAVLDEAVVRGGGMRGDRPIFLLRTYAVPAGERRVRIRFSRREVVDSTTTQHALPPELELDTAVVIRPGTVALVTIEEGAFRLIVP